MKKTNWINSLLLLFGVVMSLQFNAQVQTQRSIPSNYSTLSTGNQVLTNQTVNTTENWYTWSNDSSLVYITGKLLQNGGIYKPQIFELYKETAGILNLVYRDSIRPDSTFYIGAWQLPINTQLYIRIESAAITCSNCNASVLPSFNISFTNLQQGCFPYTHPDVCEFVQDGSFEQYSVPCNLIKDSGNPLETCFWYLPSYTNVPVSEGNGQPTTDYYNTCMPDWNNPASGNAAFPPATGSGFVGAFLYYSKVNQVCTPVPCPLVHHDYRENVVNVLNTALTLNKKYVLKMKVRLTQPSNVALNNIQGLFSTSLPNQTGPGPISPAIGQAINVTGGSFISNKSSWTTLTATFTANANYTHLTLGNFNSNAATATQFVAGGNPNPTNDPKQNVAYYVFDDVSVKEVPMFTVTPITSTICQGPVTLSVVPHTAGTSYTWTSTPPTASLSSQTGSLVVVNPTVNTTYTATSGGCLFSSDASIEVINYTLSATSSNSTYTTCVQAPVTLTVSGTGLTSFTWSPNPSIISANLNSTQIQVTPSVATTYTVSAKGPNCTKTFTAVVTVNSVSGNPSFSISATTVCVGSPVTITTSSNVVMDFLWFGESQTVPDPNPYTYTSAGTYTAYVDGTNSPTGCYGQAEYIVTVGNGCACFTCNPLGTTGTITSSPTTNDVYCINNNVTVNGAVTFSNTVIKMGSNTSITVAANSTLTINNSHLFSNTALWAGIKVNNGGTLRIINNSLIEDAITAVDVLTSTKQTNILTIDNSIINKNQTGVKISGYTQNIATAPFSITSTVFTCRTIADCNGSLFTWPSAATVKAATNPTTNVHQSPYINDVTYPVVNVLGTPRKSSRGLLLSSVGTSTVTTTTGTYNEMVVGTVSGTNTYNVFDNHWMAIDASSTNLSVYNTIFQNGFNYLFPSLYSIGINLQGASNANNRLRVTGTDYITNNKFYNMQRAIKSVNAHELAVTYCQMQSTRVFTSTATTQTGAFGVSATSNHYNTIALNNNKLYNLDNGLVFNASVGNYTVGTATGNGQYLGAITTNSNNITSNVNGTLNNNNYYGGNAISITGITSSTVVTQPTTTITTNNNYVADFVNGISVKNWTSPLPIATKQNTIANMRTQSTGYQYGIEHLSNKLPSNISAFGYGIVENSVFGYPNSVPTNTNNYAIRSEQNTNIAVSCNTVAGTHNGVAFSGAHLGTTTIFFNMMQTHRYGFVLENTGSVGFIGSNQSHSDNQWLGTWTMPNYKTATLSNSTATASIMFVRNVGATFNPQNSAFTSQVFGVTDYFVNGSTGNLRPTAPMYSYTQCVMGVGISKLANSKLSAENISMLENIANASTTSSDVIKNKANYVAKNQLFAYLKNNPDVLNKKGALTTFYNSNIGKYRDVFTTIESDVAEGNGSNARSAIMAFSPQNDLEAKHKTFYELLFKYQNKTFTTTDEQTVLDIAKGCPTIDGTMVHQARALYNIATEQNIVFTNNCNYKATSNARLGNDDNYADNAVSEQGNNVFLYPSPNSGNELFISVIDNNTTEAIVIVTNINGMLISKENVPLTNGIGAINITAPNGVYFVTVINPNTNHRAIKKLVIQK